MRGRIIQYNASEGRGTIAAGIEQHPFEIAQWRAEAAPAIDRAVEFELREGALSDIKPLAIEAMDPAQIGSAAVDKLSGFGDYLAASDTGASWSLPVGRLGRIGVVAWLGFVVAATLLSYFSLDMPGYAMAFGAPGGSMGISLLSLVQVSDSASFNGGRLLFLIALVGGCLPVFWRSAYAWLGLLLPLVVVHIISMRFAAALDDMSGGFVDMSDVFKLGLGSVLTNVFGLALAIVGILRFLSARKAARAG